MLSNLKTRLFHNWPAKVLSLLLAMGLWVGLQLSQERVGTFPGGIPIEIIHVPSGQVPILEQEMVKVTVVADRTLWARFGTDTLKATIDAADNETGVSDRFVTVTSSVPGIQITNVDPPRVLLRLEPVVSRSLPIVAQVQGQAADGYTTGDISFEPALVTLTGPRSVLEGMKEIVGHVPLSGQRATFRTSLSLSIPPSYSRAVVSVEPSQVQATVGIERAANVRSLGVIVTTLGTPPPGYTVTGLTTRPTLVTVTGPPEALDELTQLGTKPVSFGELRESSQLTTTLDLPPGVRLVDPSAPEVLITVTVAERDTTRVFELPLSPSLTSPTVRVASVVPATVTVTVSGPTSQVSKLTGHDVSVVLPLGPALTPGQQLIAVTPASVSVPTGITIETIIPSEVSVVLAPS
ncbi:hypothetical protein HY524_01640 [Candidatus Berkelbacteria bacterium]|nr:hypothetical protein [Candidatus Berkelbacteria bacterium]